MTIAPYDMAHTRPVQRSYIFKISLVALAIFLRTIFANLRTLVACFCFPTWPVSTTSFLCQLLLLSIQSTCPSEGSEFCHHAILGDLIYIFMHILSNKGHFLFSSNCFNLCVSFRRLIGRRAQEAQAEEFSCFILFIFARGGSELGFYVPCNWAKSAFGNRDATQKATRARP